MSDTVTVYRLGQPPLELDPDEIIWIDRSRIEDGRCPRKRYLRYEYRSTGILSPIRNEDFVIGGTIHEGLDLLLQGGVLARALDVAQEFYNAAPGWPPYVLPEQQHILAGDGLHMALAFIYAYNARYLEELLNNYEVLEIEEEINWLVKELEDGVGRKRFIVMMSRPDGALRDRKTNGLWHLSHKSFGGTFDELQIQKLEVDMQRFSESLSLQAKYQEPVIGTLYNYFLKGSKRKDSATGLDRNSNGLIRPYMLRQSPGGDILPEMLAFSYEWDEYDQAKHVTRNRRLTKEWERVSIYNEMDFWQWIQWLEHRYIKPPGAIEGQDYLAMSIAAHVPVYLEQAHAQRWLKGVQHSEEEWAHIVDFIGRDALDNPADTPMLDVEIPLEHSQCFSYNKRCSYHGICWKGVPVQALIDPGHLVYREPNHLQEAFEPM